MAKQPAIIFYPGSEQHPVFAYAEKLGQHHYRVTEIPQERDPFVMSEEPTDLDGFEDEQRCRRRRVKAAINQIVEREAH